MRENIIPSAHALVIMIFFFEYRLLTQDVYCNRHLQKPNGSNPVIIITSGVIKA